MYEPIGRVSPRSIFCASLMLLSALICGVALPSAARAQDDAQRMDWHYDGVLGTSLDVTMYGGDERAMEDAMAAALAEIHRLEMIFSTYTEDSELMRLNRERRTDSASPELLEVVELCESWMAVSGGVFSCRLGEVKARWDRAEREDVAPIVSELLPLARAGRSGTVTVDAQAGSIALGEGVSLDPSGLAKGYIIDRAVATLLEALPPETPLKLDIGGDARYHGAPPGGEGWEIDIAD